jgi:hypothetical protein
MSKYHYRFIFYYKFILLYHIKKNITYIDSEFINGCISLRSISLRSITCSQKFNKYKFNRIATSNKY